MVSDKTEKEIQNLTRLLARSSQHLEYALKWMSLLENGTNLLPYFEAHGCRKVGIYGMAEFGELLHKELERDGRIKVAYFMDRKAESSRMMGEIPVYLPEELAEAPEADMIVVTAFVAFPAISEALLRIKPEMPVVSLSNIINVRLNEEWTWK